MQNQSQDKQAWKKILVVMAAIFRVGFILILWMVLFTSMFYGYFSILFVILVITITIFELREYIFKRHDSQ